MAALTGGRAIAERIAAGRSEDPDADLAVLEDWLEEQQHARTTKGLKRSPYDRLAWWKRALVDVTRPACSALALGCEEMTGPEMRAALRYALINGPRPMYAAKFIVYCRAHDLDDIFDGLPRDAYERLTRARVGKELHSCEQCNNPQYNLPHASWCQVDLGP